MILTVTLSEMKMILMSTGMEETMKAILISTVMALSTSSTETLMETHALMILIREQKNCLISDLLLLLQDVQADQTLTMMAF